MDSVLASMEERARTAVIAENPDLTEEQITEAATLMLPRRHPRSWHYFRDVQVIPR